MEETTEKLRDNTGTITDKLRNMEVGEDNALHVDLIDAASTRTLITVIHQGDSGLKFTTRKTATGIKVWRIK